VVLDEEVQAAFRGADDLHLRDKLFPHFGMATTFNGMGETFDDIWRQITETPPIHRLHLMLLNLE
jgi:hypothetical protein